MIRLLDTGPPTHWFVCFDPATTYRWIRLLAFGRFKHVRAFGLAPTGQWIFHDVSLVGASIVAVPDGPAAVSMIERWSTGCEVVHIPHGRARRLPRLPVYSCVTATMHLIGHACGALRPDALRRHCLQHGGKVLDERSTPGADDYPNVYAGGARSAV